MSPENIIIQGTHTHSAIDLDAYREIYSSDRLMVTGSYTGSAALRLASTVSAVVGLDIGDCSGSVSGATIRVVGSNLAVQANNGNLVLAAG